MTESELRTYEGEECGHTTEITFLVGEDAPVHAEAPFEQRTMGCPECATTNTFVWTENIEREDETEMITHNENSDANSAKDSEQNGTGTTEGSDSVSTSDEEDEEESGVNHELQKSIDEDIEENSELYEALADEPEDEDEPTCAGKDGECSRTVDEEGETCWQHQTDDGAEA